MTGIPYLACLWTLVIAQTGFVSSDIQFIERHEGESVVLPCVTEPSSFPAIGIYLKRSWLSPSKVLFKYTKMDFSLANPADKNRISVSGDPSSHSLNVTISQLRAADTDRYFCEFVLEIPSSEDKLEQGKTEFFLLVNADVPGSVDTELVETCAGGSAVLPCHSPRGEDSVVEGVSLRRQKSQASVEVVYHSKLHHSSQHPPSVARFPAERVQLSSALGPGGITYNLTLKQLQPEDSGLYSCQLLLRGRPDSSTSLGRRVFSVSVQGGQCGCSNSSSSNQHTTVLYALSSAVGILLLILVGILLANCKARRSVKSSPQAPIYEEMVGSPSQKLAPLHLEDADSEYRNCSVKKSCPENHYESPSGSLFPRRASAIKS
ncbi:uncharacterized protein LOC121637957 [Melanotaenia boesemani]|uniref:uncharacterized protein LOC121637957 n=1 Tax=Melanotaenia boesemani TaxID=1250792 RepID=UPI001C0449CF|nr:uncharacterized protein LOC121637957 [Melanotaenia boesemani]